jgi:hypothetical protein
VRVAFLAAFILATQGLVACGSPCPDPPALPDYGSPAPQADKVGLTFEVGRLLANELVRAAVETPEDLSSGVRVDSVTFDEQSIEGRPKHVVDIGISPWLKGAPDILPDYGLRLEIVPYLITEATHSEEDSRRQILGTVQGGPSTGAVVRFEFLDMYRLARDRKVSCSDEGFSPVDKRVQEAVFKGMAVRRGTISADPGSTIVDGSGTAFREDMAALPRFDVTEWELYRASDMRYVGRVDSIASNTTLALEEPAPFTLRDDAYIAVKRPLVVPVEGLVDLVHDVSSGPARFQDLAVGLSSQGGLKLGLEMRKDDGGTRPGMVRFTSTPATEANEDWRITATTQFLGDAAKEQIKRALVRTDLPLVTKVDPVGAVAGAQPFSPLSLYGVVGLQDPLGAFSIAAFLTPDVQLGRDGNPYVILRLDREVAIPENRSLLLGIVLRAMVNVAQDAIFKEPGGCKWAIGPPASLDAFGSTLYATSLGTDFGTQSVSLGGRSMAIDSLLDAQGSPPRPALTMCEGST